MPAPSTIDLIGAPIEIGTSEPGAVMGPAALRTAGLLRVLRDLGFTVRDQGDLAPGCTPGQRDLPAIRAWMTEISQAVETALDGGSLPLVAGGDHSLSLG
jgi:arginase